MYNYNATREELILKEYGRNIQKLVEYLKKIDEKDERTKQAHTLVDLMKQINPTLKENPEYDQKVWDDLFIISQFDLDVDSPYPIPEATILTKKPNRMKYSDGEIRFRHYGRNVELLVKQAKELEDPEEKENAKIYLGRLMRSFYSTWNKDLPDESVIVKNLEDISKGDLKVDLAKVKENNLFEVFTKERKGGGKGRRQSNKKRRN